MLAEDTINSLKLALADRADIRLAVLFGSMAEGRETAASDLDLAVETTAPLTTEQKMALIGELASRFGRAIDIIDIRQIGQPLLHEIVSKGVLVKGSVSDKGDLLYRSIMMEEDFGRYQRRILEGRRNQWIGL
ncbi:nucleotidyltransferase domain-containing protein [Marinimicrobium sp. C6131]|uniref:type VII toxin-antitoxin system MntA family adenylyltransferase antitoxin n=1 Tax=Marinimicrobium sp. C6131 TaxID=3022676 RepID=UPI00223DCC9B|nr:nucleotidyltransferase domain-containing protein [Marinimicrobium sp. C6131]UZJ45358.1 nucleotidyltransferase domain-containing protein [Marinimicrobium sp. C6131]